VYTWWFLWAVTDSKSCDERKKEDGFPTVDAALQYSRVKKFCCYIFSPQPSRLRHCNFYLPCQAQQRPDSGCVPHCASMASQPIKRSSPSPVVCAVEGIMQCSPDDFCCQGSSLWQGKKDNISNISANYFQGDQMLSPSHHCEFVFQLFS